MATVLADLHLIWAWIVAHPAQSVVYVWMAFNVIWAQCPQPKNPTLANHRVLLSRTYGDERLVKKIESIAAEQKERAGGYLRVVKLPARKSDGSAMAVIQFVKE